MRSIQAILFDTPEPALTRRVRGSEKPSKEEWERWISMRKNSQSNRSLFKQL